MLEGDRFLTLLDVVEELAAENARVPIVVEGQRDVASLRDLGCRGTIHVLHNGLSLMGLAEKLANESPHVILLTDWDRKGAILFEQFALMLGANGVRLHGHYRDRIAASSAPSLQDVESLAGYVSRHLARHLGQDLHDRVAGSTG